MAEPFRPTVERRKLTDEQQNSRTQGLFKAVLFLFCTLLWVAGFAITDSAVAQTSEPSAPTDLTGVAISAHKISLSWTAATDPNGITDYYIERCKGADCTSFMQIASTAATNYADTSLNPDTTYSYRVRATDAAGFLSPYSSVATATTQTPPTAPQNLQASATSATQIAFTWTASASSLGLASYIIQRCQGADCGTFRRVVVISASTTSYVNSGLLSATTYRYRVRATDTAGNLSSFSNIASATTQSVASEPVITSATTASGTVGTAFSYQITGTNSPTSYGATGLPAGLSVDTGTGLISGTPTAAGTSTVTLSATNGAGTGNATLTVTIANGAQAQLSIIPSSVAFGNVNVGSNSSKTVTLTNAGGATLNITAATISGAGYTMTLQPTSINAGANTTFNVTFAPTASCSTPGSISITSNAPGSPATIALSGTGLQAQILATPSSVAFGSVTIGNSNSQPITLKNNGNTTLTFSQISVTGGGFGQTGLSTSTTIAAVGSASFNATFDPSSSGAVSGSITLTTNGTPSPLVISLSGTGQASTLLLGANPTSLAFGNMLDQSSSQMTTSVTNNGNANVTISRVTVAGAGFSASGIVNGTVLTPGQSATLTVMFAPTSGGPVSGRASIASNATNSPAVEHPLFSGWARHAFT